MNDYINKLKSPNGKYAGAEFKRNVDEVCSFYIMRKKAAIREICKEPVKIHFEWHEKSKRRDVDNVYSAKKYILDGMQKCGVIDNDNPRHIVDVFDSIVYDKKDFVIVRIERAENNSPLSVIEWLRTLNEIELAKVIYNTDWLNSTTFTYNQRIFKNVDELSEYLKSSYKPE